MITLYAGGRRYPIVFSQSAETLLTQLWTVLQVAVTYTSAAEFPTTLVRGLVLDGSARFASRSGMSWVWHLVI